MINTRHYKPEDERFLFKLYCSVRDAEVNGWGWSNEEKISFLRMQYDMQQRSYQLQYPELDTRMIMDNHLEIGVLRTAVSSSELVLVDISLVPDKRHLGIGSMLISKLQQDAAEKNQSIRLSVYHQNMAAQKLYKKLNFDIIKADNMYYTMVWSPQS